LGLVAKQSLPDQRTGPATEERQELQGAFWYTTTSVSCTPLIPSVGGKTHKAHDEDSSQVDRNGGTGVTHEFLFSTASLSLKMTVHWPILGRNS